MTGAVGLLSLLSGNDGGKKMFAFSGARGAVVKFVLIVAAAPSLWLLYNGIVYRNPLEFANGPYSAKAIERKTENGGNRGHPGSGNPLLAGMYFLKSAEANVAENQWLQRAWILFALAGVVGALTVPRRSADGPSSRGTRLPLKYKVRDGQRKFLLRKLALKLGVPAEVMDRPKRGFALPLAKWLRNELRAEMAESLSEGVIRKRGYFNPRAVNQVMQDHLSGKRDNSGILWQLLMFESWHRNYLQNVGARSGHLDSMPKAGVGSC